MFQYRYQDGRLLCEDVPAAELAEEYGTPLYIYSRRYIEDRIRDIRTAFAWADPLICFSVKSLSNIHVLGAAKEAACGFDIVSGGELQRVLKAGGVPDNVVYAGVGKTSREIRFALSSGILMFNVESKAELEQINSIAASLEQTARVALRFNPDVDPHTHEYTTTGRKENKFGLTIDRVRSIAGSLDDYQNVRLSGLHIHIGSQITEPEPYAEAARRAADLYLELTDAGAPLEFFNIGGGFGVDYERLGDAAPISAFAEAVQPEVQRTGARLIMEPGRFISANSCILLTSIVYVKAGSGKRFYIVDAGMNDLIRPSLYDARQEIWPTSASSPPPLMGGEEPDTQPTDVVGPICETGDFLGKARRLPDCRAGELLAVFGSGAYGFTMASNYNSRTRPPEVLVEGSSHRLIRRRETIDDLLQPETSA